MAPPAPPGNLKRIGGSRIVYEKRDERLYLVRLPRDTNLSQMGSHLNIRRELASDEDTLEKVRKLFGHAEEEPVADSEDEDVDPNKAVEVTTREARDAKRKASRAARITDPETVRARKRETLRSLKWQIFGDDEEGVEIKGTRRPLVGSIYSEDMATSAERSATTATGVLRFYNGEWILSFPDEAVRLFRMRRRLPESEQISQEDQELSIVDPKAYRNKVAARKRMEDNREQAKMAEMVAGGQPAAKRTFQAIINAKSQKQDQHHLALLKNWTRGNQEYEGHGSDSGADFEADFSDDEEQIKNADDSDEGTLEGSARDEKVTAALDTLTPAQAAAQAGGAAKVPKSARAAVKKSAELDSYHKNLRKAREWLVNVFQGFPDGLTDPKIFGSIEKFFKDSKEAMGFVTNLISVGMDDRGAQRFTLNHRKIQEHRNRFG